MPTAQAVPTPIRKLARAVAPGRAAFVDALVTLTRSEITELNHDDDLDGLLHASIEENVSRLLVILADGVSPTAAPPSGAMEYARRLGDSPVSLAALLRAYRIGQARFTEHCLTVASGLPTPLAAEQQIWVVNAISAYLDHVCEQVTIIYQSEHDRWVRGQVGERLLWLTRLLEGAEVDIRAAEAALGYGLSGPHLAAEIWSAASRADLEEIAGTIARAHGAHRGALIVRRDARRVWLWCAARTSPGQTPVEAPPGVRVAFGPVLPGPDGFARTRRKASRVRELMESARHTPQVTTYREVAAVAALTADPEAVAAMTRTVLGALAGPEERLAELRETLRVFLECGRSHTATSAAMHLHRNTVNYRVGKALALCGHDGSTFDLLAALNADRWAPART